MELAEPESTTEVSPPPTEIRAVQHTHHTLHHTTPPPTDVQRDFRLNGVSECSAALVLY